VRLFWQFFFDDTSDVLRFLIKFYYMVLNDYLNYACVTFLALKGSLFPINFKIFFGHITDTVNKTAFFNGL